jgi:signal transduction histidine kinase
VEIKTNLDEGIGKIKVIPQDFGRVIINLVNNAFDALRDVQSVGTRHALSLQTVVDEKNNQIQITIRDNGPGIPQDILDKIFNPFFTTKPAGEGTGLGLSLSYDIITKGHNGELKVKTKESEYTEFIIIIPN